MDMNSILCGDALEMLKILPDGCINMCLTSPPYYGLRDYGVDGQIGLEESPAEYVVRLVEVFREVRRVLRNDGTLWIVIGDSYAGSGKGADTKKRYSYGAGNPVLDLPKTWEHIKPKDLIGAPWMLAFALRADGWYLRSDIVWHKPNAVPHSVTDRPINSYEHIFLLAKSRRYYFDYNALEVPVQNASQRYYGSQKYIENSFGQPPQSINKTGPRAVTSTMRRGRDVWSVGTSNYKGSHFAAFPEELVRPCILAGCPEGGVVLDPFIGSGTTGAMALKLGRRYLGIELNPGYIPLAEERIKQYAQPCDVEESTRGAIFS